MKTGLRKIREDKGDMFQTLIAQGADEKLLSDFKSEVYNNARDEAEQDFAERE